jgi:hypothetical protein
MSDNEVPATTGKPAAHHPHAVHLTLSPRILALLIVLLIVPWVLALVTISFYTPLWSGGGDRADGARAGGNHTASPRTTSTLAGTPLTGHPGPWGDIEYIPINIAPPAEFVGDANWDFGPAEWRFPETTLDQVQAHFSEKDLTAAQKADLLAAIRPDTETKGFIIKPSDETIRTLSPEARGRLYRLLSLSPLNKAQVNAFRFSGKTPEDWLGGSPLEPHVADLLKSLIYRNGNYMFFADLPLVASQANTPQQRTDILRTLAHEHTFLMRLRIDDGADIEALATYWGRGGRTKDIRPIMDAMAELPGTHTLPVTYLLPGFARRRIFTYPSVSDDPFAANRDCHWSALNFFNEEPDDRLGNRQYAAQYIANNYYVIYNGYQMGDLVFYMNGPGEVIHSAVYLADDVLFTKQGSRPSNPWMLVRMEDMKDFYPSAKPLEVHFYRRKGV